MEILYWTLTIYCRKRLLKKRMSKGPYKIILTTSDFVFPQVPPVDSRTVSRILFRTWQEFLILSFQRRRKA